MNDNFTNDDHAVDADPGELIAMIPAMLGFHPIDSIVVLGLGVDQDTHLCMGIRADLPSPEDSRALVEQLAVPLASRGACDAVLVIITALEDRAVLPHRELLAECERRFADIGVTVRHRVWTASTVEGGCWRCYQHPECAGFVPMATHGGLTNVASVEGVRVYRRREDIVATLAPDPEDDLARRADLLAGTDHTASSSRARLALVDQAIERAVDGLLPESDAALTQLAAAVCEHAVRDACIWQPDPVRADAAEGLWRVLVRATPTPERAEPASLLAFAAYQRGDGVVAGIALDIAEAAEPEHRLSNLLRGLLALALPPERVRETAQRATLAARHDIAATESQP
jgi:hypothetical protein